MTPAGYLDALLTYADVKGAAGVQAINDEFDALFCRMNAQEGKQLVNASINGKSSGFQVDMTVEEKFAAFGKALRQINGDNTPSVTYPDFSALPYTF